MKHIKLFDEFVNESARTHEAIRKEYKKSKKLQ